MKDRGASRKLILFLSVLFLSVAFITICIYSAVQTNHRKISQQVEVYSVGETVELGENFFSFASENPDGYSIAVNRVELVEYEPFLKSFGMTPEDFGFTGAYTAPEYTYLLHVTITNTENEEGALMAINYALYNNALKIPVDFSLWGLMDERFTGEAGFRLRPNTQVEITIPFTPMPLDSGTDNTALSQRMEAGEFYFCVSEFPIRKMIFLK